MLGRSVGRLPMVNTCEVGTIAIKQLGDSPVQEDHRDLGLSQSPNDTPADLFCLRAKLQWSKEDAVNLPGDELFGQCECLLDDRATTANISPKERMRFGCGRTRDGVAYRYEDLGSTQFRDEQAKQIGCVLKGVASWNIRPRSC